MSIDPHDLPALAAAFVNSTHRHIFLTGKAGTGKTTFLRSLQAHTHKRLMVVAPTGIAALNAGGTTIHSQFMLPPATYVPDHNRKLSEDDHDLFNLSTLRRKGLSSAKKQVLRSIDLLVIDEVSMLRADLLDAMDARLKLVRNNYLQSFGGVQVLFIGDLLQLPPVVNRREEVLRQYYPSAHFFEAHCLKNEGLIYIELNKVFRQSDATFVDILNALREDRVTPEHLAVLNQHVHTGGLLPHNEAIALTTHNHKADAINREQLSRLNTPSHSFRAEVQGDFPENSYPVELVLELKEGARVMFIKNDTGLQRRFVNGQLGTVIGLDADRIEVLPDDAPDSLEVQRETWENKRYALDPTTKELEDVVAGQFTHYPLKLAWAVTVHKSQGLTFDRAIISVEQSFSPGQVYVALSRLRSLEGLILTAPIHPRVIQADPLALRFAGQQPAPEALPQMLDEGRRAFVTLLLDRSFTLDAVLQGVEDFMRETATTRFKEEALNQVIPGLERLIKAEVKNTEAFKQQLRSLQQQGALSQLESRIRSGSTYYTGLLEQAWQDLMTHRAQVSHFSMMKTYLEALDELDQVLYHFLVNVERNSALAIEMIHGREAMPNPAQETHRRQWRVMHMEAAAAKAATYSPEEGTAKKKGKTGRTRSKKSEPKPKAVKVSTYDQTLAMIQEGKSVAEVAQERLLAATTIEGHVAKLIEAGKVTIDTYLHQKDIQAMAAVLEQHNELAEAFQALNERYSFGQLRMVRAWMNAREKPENS
jgi:hypothetical protein